MKVGGIGLLVLIVAIVAFVHILPLTLYVPAAEKALSQRLHAPVKVGDVRYAFIPSPRLTLERVTVGRLEEIKIGTIEVSALPMELLSGPAAFNEVEVVGVSADPKALDFVPGWLKPAVGKQAFSVHRLKLRAVKIAFRGIDVPGFNADLQFGDDGTLKRGSLFDGRLNVTLIPKGGTLQAEFRANSWQPPLGPAITFDDLTATAVIEGRRARVGKIEAHLGRGTVRGSATAIWDSALQVDGEFNLSNGEVNELLPVFTHAFRASGVLNLNGTYSLRSKTIQGLFNDPRAQATFNIEKGTLNNVDIVRAVQSPLTDGIRGGKTLFSELSGTLQVSGGRYTYQHLQLGSGPMRANGEVTINPDGALTGRIRAEVGTGSIIVGRGNLAVRGDIRTPVLLP